MGGFLQNTPKPVVLQGKLVNPAQTEVSQGFFVGTRTKQPQDNAATSQILLEQMNLVTTPRSFETSSILEDNKDEPQDMNTNLKTQFTAFREPSANPLDKQENNF